MDITRIKWIDNLKLFAACGVLVGRCYSLFIGQNPYGQTIINPEKFSMAVGKIGFIWSSALSTVLCLFATMVFAWLFDRGYKYLRMLYGC